MKFRNGFVSNSSSASFIIELKESFDKDNYKDLIEKDVEFRTMLEERIEFELDEWEEEAIKRGAQLVDDYADGYQRFKYPKDMNWEQEEIDNKNSMIITMVNYGISSYTKNQFYYLYLDWQAEEENMIRYFEKHLPGELVSIDGEKV